MSKVCWGSKSRAELAESASKALDEAMKELRKLHESTLMKRLKIAEREFRRQRERRVIKRHIVLGIAHLAFAVVVIQAAEIMAGLWG